MKLTKPAIIFLIGILLLTFAVTYGVLTTYQTIPNEGAVSGIGVQIFNDSARTQSCTSINWGIVNNNSAVTHTIYVYNNGTTSETLTMTTANWNATGLTLTWNREGYLLPAKTGGSAILTLTVVTDAEAFRFDLTITGTT